jgi:hypothetical protein
MKLVTDGRTDRQTDSGKTVNPPSGGAGYNSQFILFVNEHISKEFGYYLTVF